MPGFTWKSEVHFLGGNWMLTHARSFQNTAIKVAGLDANSGPMAQGQ